MVYVGSEMYECGADGINFDTAAAAGDAEFLATLKAIEILRKKYPKMCIMMGMASEFILGCMERSIMMASAWLDSILINNSSWLKRLG